jgi:tetratricopeptide (TPR) repeat protein
VPEHPRIEELRRRVLKDKASIAFAQLAEEYRRAGRFDEAIEACRTGLAHHPGYLSAHVTLGRALIEVGELAQAQEELKHVLAAAPENLAALKGLADIHYRRGEQQEALVHYRRALEFAPHDPDLEHLVAQIARDLEPDRPQAAVPGGLSFEEAMGEFLALDGQAPPAAEPAVEPGPAALEPAAEPVPMAVEPAVDSTPASSSVVPDDAPVAVVHDAAPPAPSSVPVPEPDPVVTPDSPPADTPNGEPRAAVQVAALERWLDAILANRQNNPH